MVVGLRNKREIWRVHTLLSKMRTIARILLTLPEKVRARCVCTARCLTWIAHLQDPKRLFEGQALLRRLNRYGLLSEASCWFCAPFSCAVARRTSKSSISFCP